jgi:uncharacterized protein (DUF362 family)
MISLNKNVINKIRCVIVLLLVLTCISVNLAACNNNNDIVASTTIRADQSIDKGSKAEKPGISLTGLYTPYAVGPFKQSIVSIVQSDKVNKAQDLTQKDIYDLVKEAVSCAGGLNGIVKDGDVVVLKPNLVSANDYTLPNWKGKPLTKEVNGNCTDYRFTRAVAQIVREVNPTGKIYVMEGSCQDTEKVMNSLNYTKEYIPEVDKFLAIENVSGDWKDKNSNELVGVSLKDGYLNDTYYVNKQIFKADALITLPTLKNHWDAGITGGIKNIGIGATPANIYGIAETIHGRNNMVDHGTINLHKWIADFYTSRPADFTITDGLQGLQNGPTPSYEVNKCTNIEDNQKNMRLVLAGRDAVAVDTVQTNIMNWDYTTIPYLNYLSDKGIGNTDARKITVVGNRTVDAIRTDFDGIIPSVAGKKLVDKTAPILENVTAVFSGNLLKVTHRTNDDCVKTEIYANNVLVGQALDSTAESEFNVAGLANGQYEIKVVSYDKYMHQTTKTATATKNSDSSEVVKDGNYKATYVSVSPLIDGKSDGIWDKAVWGNIDQLWLGQTPTAEDFKGKYKMLWDENYLYYLVEITDNVISEVRTNPLQEYYEDDCLELFIDEDRIRENHMDNYNAFAYHLSTLGDAADLDSTNKARLFTQNIDYKITPKGTVYTWEVALKIYDKTYNDKSDANVPVTLKAGKLMGFANAYCDADESGKREHFMGSIFIKGEGEAKNIAWKDTGVFGDLELVK